MICRLQELRLLKDELGISRILSFVLFIYVALVPMRRIAHYNHTTLDTYWPNEYVAPATHTMLTFTNATSQRRESLRLDHYIAIVAPRLKLGRATIQKDDVLRACVGCIKAPLRLRDFGHQLVPDLLLTHDPSISEYVVLATVMFAVCSIFVPLLTETGVNLASMMYRALRVVVLMHSLRPFFYLATSMPGTPMHCQPSVVHGGGGKGTDGPHIGPRGDSFYDFLSMLFVPGGKSCGDLLFSGHMIASGLVVLFAPYFAARLLNLRGENCGWLIVAGLVVIALTLFIAQAYLIIAVRNHYTMDVVTTVTLCVPFMLVDVYTNPDIVPKDESDWVRNETRVKWQEERACDTLYL